MHTDKSLAIKKCANFIILLFSFLMLLYNTPSHVLLMLMKKYNGEVSEFNVATRICTILSPDDIS